MGETAEIEAGQPALPAWLLPATQSDQDQGSQQRAMKRALVPWSSNRQQRRQQICWQSKRMQVAVVLTVSMRQARLALLGLKLLDPVETAIAAMAGTEGKAAQIEWEYATEVKRDSPLVSGLAQALQLDDEILDRLFAVGATL